MGSQKKSVYSYPKKRVTWYLEEMCTKEVYPENFLLNKNNPDLGVRHNSMDSALNTWKNSWLSGVCYHPCLYTAMIQEYSMTSLLTHTVAYSTRSSFRPKTNKQPTKKCLSLTVTWVKVIKMCKILTFKVKKDPNLSKKNFIEEYHLWNTFFVIAFLTPSIFKPLYFLKWHPIFDNFYATDWKT